MLCKRKLQKELKRITQFPPPGCSAGLKKGSLDHWTATIMGPPDTPYEGGIFKLDIKFPKDYPFSAPKVYFETKVFHPNISSSGEICLDILKDQWAPCMGIESILISLCSLLETPNPDDPLDASAANLYRTNKHEYEAKVREYVRQHAM